MFQPNRAKMFKQSQIENRSGKRRPLTRGETWALTIGILILLAMQSLVLTSSWLENFGHRHSLYVVIVGMNLSLIVYRKYRSEKGAIPLLAFLIFFFGYGIQSAIMYMTI